MEEGTKCKICAKDIPIGARKCTECGEFQSAFARVLAGLDLKGLLALLPLVTLIYAFLAESFESKRSHVMIGSPQCEKTGVKIFVSNLGSRHGLVRHVDFSATETNPGLLVPPEDEGALLLAPGDARMIFFTTPRSHPNGLVDFAGMQLKPNCSVTLDFRVVNFDQSEQRIQHRCDCP